MDGLEPSEREVCVNPGCPELRIELKFRQQ